MPTQQSAESESASIVATPAPTPAAAPVSQPEPTPPVPEVAPVPDSQPATPPEEESIDKRELASVAARFNTTIYEVAGAFAQAGKAVMPLSEFKAQLAAFQKAEV